MKIGSKIQQIFALVTCFLMLTAVAINKNQKILGHELKGTAKTSDTIPTRQELSDGTILICTNQLAKDVMGYGGAIPLEIYIKDGRITEIKALRNAESPEFFNKVKNSKIFSQFIGMPLNEAAQMKVDAVSGATLSSNATIETIRRGILCAQNSTVTKASSDSNLITPKFLCTVLIILAGAFLPFFIHSKKYRTVQLALNVLILGFWSGSFISYSLIVNYLSNGVNIWVSLIPILLLIIAFIFPLFGKKSHYCNWVCPLGSLQELAGKCNKNKWKIKPQQLKYLNYFHDSLWAVLMLFMWSGVLFQWMDYELFSAFIFTQASTIVIVLALLFISLSFFVNRPYCRFVCPTGTLLKLPQNMN